MKSLLIGLFLIAPSLLNSQTDGAGKEEKGRVLTEKSDTIPFVLSDQNNIVVSTVLNRRDTLNLKFDSGATGLLLTHDAIEKKTSLLAEADESETQDYVRMDSPVILQIGPWSWDSLYVYPVRLSGHGTDGRFGWDLFDGKILEFDYDQHIMVVHAQLPDVIEGYTRLNMVHQNTLFCIEGDLIANNHTYPNKFLFDSGYQRALLLDSVLMDEQNFPKNLPVLKVNQLRNGAGKVFETKVVNCDALRFRDIEFSNIPAQLLNTANPAGFKVHILGNELLKRFNTYLDFQHNHIYLKLNSLSDVPYVDATN